MRFRTKTILGVALIELVLLAILIGSALSLLLDSNEAELTRRLQLGGKLLAVAAKDAVITQDLATLHSLVTEAMDSGQIDYIRILDADGVVLAEQGKATVLARPFHQEARIDEVTDGIYDWSAPVLAGGIRYGEVQLGVSTFPLKLMLASARRWAAGIAGLEMLLVALFSWLLGSYLTRQLNTLRKASVRFAAGDFGHRVPVGGDDDLAQTALAFNGMAQQLGESRDLLNAENVKRLESQRRAEDRTEQLNAIFALSPDGFVSFDGGRRVAHANEAFTRMTGIGLAQLGGIDEQDFSDLLAQRCVAGARFPGIEALRGSALGDAPGKRVLIELAAAGKRILEVCLRASDSSTVSQLVHFRDVTHETEVDRMKSEFLSTAAHELRTPMASIQGFAELLLTQDFDEASRREFLSIIFSRSEQLGTVVNELLDLARIEARRGKDFAFKPTQVQTLLAEVVSGYKPPPGRSAPTLALPEAPSYMMADRRKAQQAILNVLANAYKYSPGGGEVSITVLDPLAGTVADAPAGQAPPMVAIRIVDRGIGMSPEQLLRVCDRFYRADASGSVSGTGLGMSIVKEIVDLHLGSVEIESTEGQSTCVTLRFPACRADPGSPADPTDAAGRRPGA